MASRAFMDRYGKVHYADEETATFRTAYYAIIIKDKKVLLTALPRFDLFEFPGGGRNAEKTSENVCNVNCMKKPDMISVSATAKRKFVRW